MTDNAIFETIRTKLFSAVIGDVMDTMGLTRQFLPPELRPLDPDRMVIGRAMPVLEADCASEVIGHSGKSDAFGLLFQALDQLRPGEVYVCTGSSPRYALWGGLMSTRAAALGAAGAVLDGYHRDTRDILSLGFPVFSSGAYAQDQRLRGRVVDYRCTIEFRNGARIAPGDLIVGDIDGVLSIPGAAVGDVVRAALAKVEGEERVRRMIEDGDRQRRSTPRQASCRPNSYHTTVASGRGSCSNRRIEEAAAEPILGGDPMKRLVACAFALAGLAFAAGPTLAQEKLTVWWVKGFYKSEDEALFAAVKKFEQKTGVKVDLSQYAVQDMIPKTVAALDSGSPPDVAYADSYDVQVAGKWAFEGKLEDLSDILNPMKAAFAPNTIETAFLYNDKTKKKAYYAFPLKQQTMHVQIWGDLLEKSGFKVADIPTEWSQYWAFWCDKVQPGFRKESGTRGYGIGMPMGVESTDSFQSFLTFMDAYNVKLVDDEGKLLVDDPKVKAGLVSALKDYTDPYIKGCTPPSSTTWKDPDNNVAFHNKTTVMTHNFTISIAAKWFEDSTNETLTPEQRAAGKKAYEETIITAGFPKKPDGSTMKYRASIKVGLVFADAKLKARGKEFVQFLLDEPNLQPYVEGALGRWFPVTTAGQKSAFWQADRHRKAVYNQFMDGTLPFEFVKNYKFTILNNENIWAKAMNRVVSEKVPVDKAVDEMIARMKQVAG